MTDFVHDRGLWLPASQPEPTLPTAPPTAQEPLTWDQVYAALERLEKARQDAKRTILCEPHREYAIRAAVDQLDAADVFTVRASPVCPEGQLLIINEAAIEAACRPEGQT